MRVEVGISTHLHHALAHQRVDLAWFEAEHDAYGFDFPSLGRRFEYLEESLQIFRAMFTQERASFDGEYFRVRDAYNNPKPIRGDISPASRLSSCSTLSSSMRWSPASRRRWST